MTQSEDKLITPVTDSTFDDLVLKSNKPAIVIVSAGWSAQHKMMKQIIASCAQEYRDMVKAYSVDLEQNSMITGHHPVTTLPIFLSIQHGEIISRTEGVLPKPVLKSLFEDLIED